eukprot:Plantae.Rhodophyta-Hildenbrandia_rubra.ctg3755.p1 GENE.Plantae.Rhodophyta-Hildenbrandia_rubra.ctg3755~~Plantae.Rhodophyta-Hildenbrandia_rubra.ctg3755.p1  ORF type:complete len:1148 (-),score=278.84 Plantae.Rhodophyta-Hildenbrandia_rubra.ctg3755:5021-8464(-)
MKLNRFFSIYANAVREKLIANEKAVDTSRVTKNELHVKRITANGEETNIVGAGNTDQILESRDNENDKFVGMTEELDVGRKVENGKNGKDVMELVREEDNANQSRNEDRGVAEDYTVGSTGETLSAPEESVVSQSKQESSGEKKAEKLYDVEDGKGTDALRRDDDELKDESQSETGATAIDGEEMNAARQNPVEHVWSGKAPLGSSTGIPAPRVEDADNEGESEGVSKAIQNGFYSENNNQKNTTETDERADSDVKEIPVPIKLNSSQLQDGESFASRNDSAEDVKSKFMDGKSLGDAMSSSMENAKESQKEEGNERMVKKYASTPMDNLAGRKDNESDSPVPLSVKAEDYSPIGASLIQKQNEDPKVEETATQTEGTSTEGPEKGSARDEAKNYTSGSKSIVGEDTPSDYNRKREAIAKDTISSTSRQGKTTHEKKDSFGFREGEMVVDEVANQSFDDLSEKAMNERIRAQQENDIREGSRRSLPRNSGFRTLSKQGGDSAEMKEAPVKKDNITGSSISQVESGESQEADEEGETPDEMLQTEKKNVPHKANNESDAAFSKTIDESRETVIHHGCAVPKTNGEEGFSTPRKIPIEAPESASSLSPSSGTNGNGLNETQSGGRKDEVEKRNKSKTATKEEVGSLENAECDGMLAEKTTTSLDWPTLRTASWANDLNPSNPLDAVARELIFTAASEDSLPDDNELLFEDTNRGDGLLEDIDIDKEMDSMQAWLEGKTTSAVTDVTDMRKDTQRLDRPESTTSIISSAISRIERPPSAPRMHSLIGNRGIGKEVKVGEPLFRENSEAKLVKSKKESDRAVKNVDSKKDLATSQGNSLVSIRTMNRKKPNDPIASGRERYQLPSTSSEEQKRQSTVLTPKLIEEDVEMKATVARLAKVAGVASARNGHSNELISNSSAVEHGLKAKDKDQSLPALVDENATKMASSQAEAKARAPSRAYDRHSLPARTSKSISLLGSPPTFAEDTMEEDSGAALLAVPAELQSNPERAISMPNLARPSSSTGSNVESTSKKQKRFSSASPRKLRRMFTQLVRKRKSRGSENLPRAERGSATNTDLALVPAPNPESSFRNLKKFLTGKKLKGQQVADSAGISTRAAPEASAPNEGRNIESSFRNLKHFLKGKGNKSPVAEK